MIRFAVESDNNVLATLSMQVWLEIYAQDGVTEEHAKYVFSNFTPQAFKTLLNSPSYKVIVAYRENFLVGLAVVNLSSQFQVNHHGFEIERLYIHPSHRKIGHGRAIFDFISVELGKRFWLYTWVENASNEYYEHLGFKKIGEHRFCFGNQEIENNVYARIDI